MGQVWMGLAPIVSADLHLVVSLEDRRRHSTRYRCLNLETGEVIDRTEEDGWPWEERTCRRLV